MTGDRPEHIRKDLNNGHLVIYSFGYSAGLRHESLEHFEEEYGINVVVTSTAGCIVTPTTIERTREHNRHVAAVVSERFGEDALDELDRSMPTVILQ